MSLGDVNSTSGEFFHETSRPPSDTRFQKYDPSAAEICCTPLYFSSSYTPQLMVNWWFGLVVWIPSPYEEDCYLGVS